MSFDQKVSSIWRSDSSICQNGTDNNVGSILYEDVSVPGEVATLFVRSVDVTLLGLLRREPGDVMSLRFGVDLKMSLKK